MAEGGWSYFPDYDEVQTIASEASDAIAHLPADEKKSFKRAVELVKKIRRKTRPGVEHRETLQHAFSTYDTNEDDQLDRPEFLGAMRNLLGDDLPSADSDLLFNHLDDDRNGFISLQELVDGVETLGKKKPEAQEEGEIVAMIVTKLKRQTRMGWSHSEALSHAFKRFDTSEDGALGFEELYAGVKNYLGRHGKGLTRGDVSELFDRFDHDGSGTLDVEEFIDGIENFGKESPSDSHTTVSDLVEEVRSKLWKMDEAEQVEHLMMKFAAFDTSQNGALDYDEFHAGLQNFLGRRGLSMAITKRMFDYFDVSRARSLDLKELAEGVVHFADDQQNGADDDRSLRSDSRYSHASIRSGGSRAGGSRISVSSRGSGGQAVDVSAREVWHIMQDHINEVGEDRFSIPDFEDRLRAELGLTQQPLNYKTHQRIRIASEKHLGQHIHNEFAEFA